MRVELLPHVQLNAPTPHSAAAGYGRGEHPESQAWRLFVCDPFGLRVELFQSAAGLP